MSIITEKSIPDNASRPQEGERVLEKEVSAEARKRPRFDKNKNLLKKIGCWFRVKLYRKYQHIAIEMGIPVYELWNDAGEYYYEHVLRKRASEKLRDAGQEELRIDMIDEKSERKILATRILGDIGNEVGFVLRRTTSAKLRAYVGVYEDKANWAERIATLDGTRLSFNQAYYFFDHIPEMTKENYENFPGE